MHALQKRQTELVKTSSSFMEPPPPIPTPRSAKLRADSTELPAADPAPPAAAAEDSDDSSDDDHAGRDVSKPLVTPPPIMPPPVPTAAPSPASASLLTQEVSPPSFPSEKTSEPAALEELSPGLPNDEVVQDEEQAAPNGESLCAGEKAAASRLVPEETASAKSNDGASSAHMSDAPAASSFTASSGPSTTTHEMLCMRMSVKKIKGLAAMMSAGGGNGDEKPEKCGVLMWIADSHGEPLGPIAEWPARKGVAPLWNSARQLVQTMHPAEGRGPAKVHIELWGELDDHSRVPVAGPASLTPSKVPMMETILSLQRSAAASASKAFNPVPPASLVMRCLPSIPRPLVAASQRKTLFFIRHGESKWNAAKRGTLIHALMHAHAERWVSHATLTKSTLALVSLVSSLCAARAQCV